MKPFNIEAALAGELVKLRNGEKAVIVFNTKNLPYENNHNFPLLGYIIDEDGELSNLKTWTLQGEFDPDTKMNSGLNIVGMWEKPRATVTLTLPCPLKEPREGMYRLSEDLIIKSSYKIERPNGTYSKKAMDNGLYFATESDAQAWVDALKNSRR